MNEFYQQIREQVGRIWENLSIQQKIIFVAAPVVLLFAMVLAVYLASRPQYVNLVTLEDPAQLSRIAQELDSQNIKYEIKSERTIMVDKTVKPRISLDLAGKGLIGPDTGVGWSLFDQTRLGMTDRQFDVQSRRALQNELEKTIISGADNITDARVHINIPEPSLFREDASNPSASVKVIGRGSLPEEQVLGIQNLVAMSVPRLKAEQVAILDSRNNLLSEVSTKEAGVAKKSKQLEVQLSIENILRTKLENALYTLVGSDNYHVVVNAVLDWQEKETKQIQIQSDSQAVLSEKSYEETNSSPSISGPPGVESNVQTQDTGIGASTTVNSEISETITNYQYPWFESFIKEGIGEVKEISISVAINNIEDDNGNKVARFADAQAIADFEKYLRVSVGLPPIPQPGDPPHKFILYQYAFDESAQRSLARERLWSNIIGIIKMIIPLLLLFGLGYFVYIFFQSAFAPPEIEVEEEEEIPIEPVTEAKELTLSQLGLAEFGDIASLPAEEQRRLKMQEHVINYAAEKPEEVAAIIKAWLSG